jgi:hypothetical protein
MTDDPTPIGGELTANVAPTSPRQTPGYRSAVTARPEARLNGNSPAGRRVRDLYRGLMQRLDSPADITMQAAVLALSELLTAAENARANLLEGRVQSSNELVRLENLVRRAEIRVGLVPGALSTQQDPDAYRYGGLFIDDDGDDDAEEPAQ